MQPENSDSEWENSCVSPVLIQPLTAFKFAEKLLRKPNFCCPQIGLNRRFTQAKENVVRGKRKEKPKLHVYGELMLSDELLPWERDLLVLALKSLFADQQTTEQVSGDSDDET